MEFFISMDEFGRFWVLDEDDQPVHGPYDTPEEANEAVSEEDDGHC
jgi:hypothetical protein